MLCSIMLGPSFVALEVTSISRQLNALRGLECSRSCDLHGLPPLSYAVLSMLRSWPVSTVESRANFMSTVCLPSAGHFAPSSPRLPH
jgi:hypothetical protein